jgi:hypothetical protein
MSPKAVNTVPLLLVLVFPVAVRLPSLISGNGQVELKKMDVGSDISNIKPSEDEPAGSDVIVDPVLLTHIHSSISNLKTRRRPHPSAI